MQDRTGTVKTGFAQLWKVIPAWSATLLFGFQPVAQLVRHPSSCLHTWQAPLSGMHTCVSCTACPPIRHACPAAVSPLAAQQSA